MRRVCAVRVVAAVVAAIMAAPLPATLAAAEEPALQHLLAPFACGTEWKGSTRSGHGLNDWNLDLNRTSRTYADPQHDLGQPLLAQADGTVVYLGNHVSAGTYVEIDYGDITVRYVHLVDDSIPPHLAQIGAEVVLGEVIGLLGDTGNATHAHLHLEYFDSRDHDDAPWWRLPSTNQIQIVMDGEPIEPAETFVSTNCGDQAPPPTTTTPTTTTTVPVPHPFADVDPSSFAYTDVGVLFDLEITTGTSPDLYSPRDEVTREQMAAFIARVWRLVHPDARPSSESLPFDDLDEASFAYDDIHLLFDLEITNGTGADRYSPAEPVTRQQMAAFVARLWHRLRPEWPEPDGEFPFADVADDSYARADVHLLHAVGITNGTSPTTYSPGEAVTREQMASFLARLLRAAELP